MRKITSEFVQQGNGSGTRGRWQPGTVGTGPAAEDESPGGARSREILLLGLLFGVCLALCLIYNDTDFDIWARMAVGKLFFELVHVSRHDIFAYTPTKPLWVDHEWGSGVLFFLAADAFGQKGLLLLRALCYFLTIFLIHRTVKERLPRPYGLLFHLFLAKALLFGFAVTVRSQVFTYLLFSLWLWLLERSRRGRAGGLIVLPVSMILWANLHGGFLAGLGLLVIYGAGQFLNRRPWKVYVVLLGLCSLCTLLNPYGLGYWTYVLHATLLPRTMIPEWWATDLTGPLWSHFEFKVMLALTLFGFVADRIRGVWVDWVDVLLVAVTGYLAVRHVRHTTFFVLASAPFVYLSWGQIWRSLSHGLAVRGSAESARQVRRVRQWGSAVLHGSVLAAVLLAVAFLPFRIRIRPTDLPVRAVRFIQQNQLRGNLLLPFTWGNYAIWELYPQCKVACDGRYEEVYEEELFLEIHHFDRGMPGWKETLSKYPHDIILISRESPVSAKMREQSGWVLVYEDDHSLVFLRPESARGNLIMPGPEVETGDAFSTRRLGRYLDRPVPDPS